MVSIKTLLPELQELVGELTEDLLARSTSDPKIDAGLRDAFQQIERGGRTAQAFEVWRDDYLDQVAVAWVLACVFVRFLEDNHLIDECWLAGEGDRRKLAEDTHELFFREHPHDTDREYFQHVFHEVGKIPAAKDLFAEGKTPLWAVAPSGDAAMSLLRFWREIDAEAGKLKRSFQVENGDTRFLGDLYQELSERAQKKFALLQTPVFVEEFILDRTLTPAIAEFGLEKVRMIDPTCGSGHFLLGGFARLFRLWSQRESNEIKAAQRALDGVWGVDINPFAIAIARFRLIVAAVQACGIKRLKQAPGWVVHVATGDSLLLGNRWHRSGAKMEEQGWLGGNDGSWAPEIYACEDKDAIAEVLGQQYHAVVGNPPYITVKDAGLNAAYRARYSTCHRQYSLGVPFTERFFDLCLAGDNDACGYVGMITANSFMKREFGKTLIERFLPTVELTHVIDTSGMGPTLAGHGTGTVILFGRNRKPVPDTVRAVFGIRQEPTMPDDPSQGLVWRSILKHVDSAGREDEYTSTSDLPRSTFASHPWSIGGGGVGQVKDAIEDACRKSLGDLISDIGRSTHTGEDDVFYLEPAACRTQSIDDFAVPLIEGVGVRDYGITFSLLALFPYDKMTAEPIALTDARLQKHFWRYRRILKNRRDFGEFIEDRGLRWFDHSMFFPARYRSPLSIAFAFLSTHNHFVLDRGGKVFNRTAPIIKLPAGAGEDEHLALCGLLNSSTACFWIKQIMSPKAGGGVGRGIQDEKWEVRYDISGTQLASFPVPKVEPHPLTKSLDQLGRRFGELLPDVQCQTSMPTAERLAESRTQAAAIRGRMIAAQEELDWHCYYVYGLLSQDLSCSDGDLPELALGQRAFEIVLARQMARGELKTSWFERHGSTPVTEIPSHWPATYRRLVEDRIHTIETSKEIALIEKPEYKRRWNSKSWNEQEQRALRNWLLGRLESPKYRKGATEHPELTTTAQMADVASADAEFLKVASLYRGRPDFDVAALVSELVEGEAVPFLPILRYKPSGLRKRQLWERTWDMQRQEDAGGSGAEIPVPPKYVTADFVRTDYWNLRKSLDVPKERWISYPHCCTESDPSLVVGWAGWSHLEQAVAIIAYYDARKREGWDAKRLTPLLAGLDQLLPWIHQWHPEIDPEFGETAGQSFQTVLEQDAHELGLTLEDIRNWTPPATTTRRRRTRN